MDTTRALIRRRFARSEHELVGYDSELRQIVELLTRLANNAESNSLLVLGGRGTGKRHLVRSALAQAQFSEPKLRACLRVVRLSGLLQTDDRLALREIARQLGLDEQLRVAAAEAGGGASFAEQFRCLLCVLHGGGGGGRCVLFVLEQFDLFAQHKNQALLYNLLDAAQAGQLPVCVLGLSARLDVLEQLEKRVKSRFSHRQLQLCPPAAFEQFATAARRLLCAPLTSGTDKEALRGWNKSVEAWLREPDVLHVLRDAHHLSYSLGELKRLLALPLAAATDSRALQLDSAQLRRAFELLHGDAKGHAMRALSVLELSLMTAAVHLAEAYDGEPLNYEMVYAEYARFCARRAAGAAKAAAYSKPVAAKAFEQLLASELVVPATATATATGGAALLRSFRPVLCLVEREQLLGCLRASAACPTDLMQWASGQRVAA